MTWPFSKPQPVEVTLEDLRAFLRGGGAVTLGEWANLDPATRDTLAQAGTEVAVERAALLAAAIHGHTRDLLAEVHPEAVQGATLAETLRQALAGRKVVRDG